MQVFKNLIFFWFQFLIVTSSNSQQLFEKNIFNGGVVVGSYSQGISFQYTNGIISVDLSNSIQILSARLFFNSDATYNFESMEFNNITFYDNSIISNYNIQLSSNNNLEVVTNSIDVKQAINVSQNNYAFSINNTDNKYLGPFVLLVTYTNSMSNTICYNLYLNNQDLLSINQFTLDEINNVSNGPVAFSLHSNILWDTISDGSFVTLNGLNLGLIGGTDNNSGYIGAGVSGTYKFENNSLFALNDDNVNFQMDGSDGLSDISTIYGNEGLINLNLQTQTNFMHFNDYMLFTLAYSTPCQPQNVTVSNDTVICPNVPLQLNATGGTPNSHSTSGYEWLPQQNLSCYDCANPVFTGDSSQLYTVRIWGSDSCSVVRPVMVRVRPEPVFSSFNSIASECGGATGSISVSCNTGVSYSLDSLNWQASINSAYQFQNLASGIYTVYVTDTSGCVGDSSVFLDEILTVNAAFTASPTSGAVPLSVSFSNQSANYTNLEWLVAGTSQGNTLNSYAISQSGMVEIMLVAWQNDPSCADTAVLSILAFDSLIISIPNIITPNSDGVNDVFSISSNLPIDVEFQISNRWGNVVADGKVEDQQGEILLWNGSSTSSLTDQEEVADGVYFYTLKFSSKNVAIEEQLEKSGKEKQGFLTVVK